MNFSNREWMTRALCRGKAPEIFAPESQGAGQHKLIEEAIAICHRCPVIDECRAYSDDSRITYGVWGGRWIIRKGAAYDALDWFRHGTEAGFKRHERRGEVPCQPCKNGQQWARNERRRRKEATL